LPAVGFPTFGWDEWQVLLGTAAAISLVILAQSAATSRAYAAKYGERFSEDVDLVGLGAANLSAGLTGTFVVNGSPTKSKMVESAGGRSQLSMLVTAAIVLAVILFFTVPLSYMPNAVLSSIVFLIGLELIDYRGMSKILVRRRDEFVIAAVTAFVVIAVGVMQGIVLAIALSVIDHLRFSYRPHDGYVEPTPDGGRSYTAFDSAPEPVEARPNLVVYRFGGNLYYANSERFSEEVRSILTAEPSLSWLCLLADAIGDVDYTGGETLRELKAELTTRGVRPVFAEVTNHVHTQLEHDGLVELFGADAFYDTLEHMFAAYDAAAPTATAPAPSSPNLTVAPEPAS
jgi:MFS superfamily sulfate permease-like transporter